MSNTIFKSVEVSTPPRNPFNLSHSVKMSGRMGTLMPCLVHEVVPGDKFSIGADIFVRLAPLVAPIMHRVDVYCHYFFVPNRIVWPGWESFIVQEQGAPAFPFVTLDGTELANEKRFLDYMGVPVITTPNGFTEDISAIPLAGYQKIYNEYYRDQNLIAPVTDECINGDNTANLSSLAALRLRSFTHDYFTSALPDPQKGSTPVDIPMGDVVLKPSWNAAGSRFPYFADTTGAVPPAAGPVGNDAPGQQIFITPTVGPIIAPVAYNPDGTLAVDAATITDLRRAMKLQEWLEKNARGGTRYIEHILMHFGVRSSDARLQRPEYIGGVKSPIIVSEVLNTTGTTGQLPQGNMAGHGVSVGSGNYGKLFAEEHGYIIGILSIIPKPCYAQGIPKHWLKREVLDFYYPSFAHIGEQEIQVRELFAFDATAGDTFGWTPRYAEYKDIPDRIAGDFRSTLAYWTLTRFFTNAPVLDDEFIEVLSDDFDDAFAVQAGDDNLYIHIMHKIRAVRPMPVFGSPMI